MKSKKRIVGIDLFSGAGGMSLGAFQAGIEILYAVENCPKAAGTYRRNFRNTPIFTGDIRSLKDLPGKPKDAKTVIFGGPPCQGFSTSNQKTRTEDNPDNWMFKEFVRVVKLWSPDWVVMENVKGILETSGGMFFRAILESLELLGYATSFRLLNAADYEVPQNRFRAFIVGSRCGGFEFPLPTTKRTISVGRAIEDLPALRNGAAIDIMPYKKNPKGNYAKTLRTKTGKVSGNLVTKNAPYVLARYSYVPQGGNWEDIPSDLFENYQNPQRCHTGIYKRLDPNKPSVVIGNFRKNMLIHPTEHRGLSVREAARIQSVPDKFVFEGSIGFQQQQVGNMVPPRLALAVFREICRK